MAVWELVWKFFTPFWLMQDASRGTPAQRRAAYHHNRRMRGCLPVYVRRWLLSCTVALLLTALFEPLGQTTDGTLSLFMVLAAAYALFAAVGICAAMLLAYTWFYLTYCREITPGSAPDC